MVVKTEFDRQLAASNSAASNVMQAVIPTSTQAAPPAAVSSQAIVAGRLSSSAATINLQGPLLGIIHQAHSSGALWLSK